MKCLFCTALFSGVILSSSALVAAEHSVDLTLKDHRFFPAEISVPANTKFILTLKNEDDSAAEFESYELNREKIVAAKATITINLGPLDAGTYSFMDEFHQETATGKLIVK